MVIGPLMIELEKFKSVAWVTVFVHYFTYLYVQVQMNKYYINCTN